MKQIQIILIILPLIMALASEAQTSTCDTLYWENNNYSLTSELGQVWIHLKKGRSFKVTRINYIDVKAGKIEYLSEGVFHDVKIENIEKITPGKFYNNALSFDKENVPVIRSVFGNNQFEDLISFKSYTLPKKELSASPVIKTEKRDSSITNYKASANQINSDLAQDVIIFSDKQIVVKIISIDEETVSYKRADLMDGPVYTIKLRIPGRMTSAKVTHNKNFIVIDYSQ